MENNTNSTGAIDKEHIYEITSKINDCLHFDFGVKDLYHRMIFTACALVAERYGAELESLRGSDYETLNAAIRSTLSDAIEANASNNDKIDILLDEYSYVKMNTTENQKAIDDFIGWVVEIFDCINSNEWRGEDVMGILFNEFSRYKKKSDAGQVFTPEHITDFMYRILGVAKDDRVLDATCGSGGFLFKAMANMIQETGGVDDDKTRDIKSEQIYGIEFDRDVYALACANMLIHDGGNTDNLVQMDARTEEAGEWIASKHITKVLMNPPYENKYGCMTIVENVLDHVPSGTVCGFILPEKKIEKTSKKQMKRILSNHKLTKVIKMPEDLFFGVGVTTSIFVFEAGVPQNGEKFFACYMESDGLIVVKNKGRHDVHGKWPEIEKHWVDVMANMSGDDSCQLVDPAEHLSYQTPPKPFVIREEDFAKTALDYLLWQKKVNAAALREKMAQHVMYSAEVVSADDEQITLKIRK